MGKEIRISNHIFYYNIIDDSFVVITGYENSEGPIAFVNNEYCIDVPETIDNLPVFSVSSVYLNMKTEECIDGYRHNGSTVIVLNLPENTSFSGFSKLYTAFGCFSPSYRIQYYKRTKCDLLFAQEDQVCFFAKVLSDETCEIVQICASHWHSDDNVWDPRKKVVHTYIEVPGYIKGYKVVSLAPGSTPLLPHSLSVIRFADEITTIGNDCFAGLPHLKKLYLGKNLERIGDNCFSFFEDKPEGHLTKVPKLTVYYHTMPQKADSAFLRYADYDVGEDHWDWGWMKTGEGTVTYETVFKPYPQYEDIEIDGDKIIGCRDDISGVTVPEGIRTIGNGAFENNVSLETIVLPYGLEVIGDFAFSNCRKLKEIIIPETVTSIGCHAFNNCVSLTSINIPEKVRSLNKGVFYGCKKLCGISLCEGVESIAEEAFFECAVQEITIPGTVKKIDSDAFSGCSDLETVSFIGAVEDIDSYAFEDCPKIRNLKISKPFAGVRSLFESDHTLNIYIEDLSAWCSASASSIDPPYRLYVNEEQIKDLIIPSDVTKIEEDVFSGCVSLRSVTVPGEVSEIGETAFYNCENLKNVVLSEGLTSIGKRAFQHCHKLKSIALPESLNKLGIYAFGFSDSFDSVIIKSIEKWCMVEFGANERFGRRLEYYSPFSKEYSLFVGESPVTELTVPGCVPGVPEGAFNLCKSIRKVTIENGVKEIGYLAFNCPELETVILPESVEYIASDAFGEKNDKLSIYAPSGSYAEKWIQTEFYKRNN